MKKIVLKYLVFLSFLTPAFLVSCHQSGNKTATDSKGKEKKTQSELTRIMKSGQLRAVVDYNSTNYFIYRGTIMGFEYELLKQLSKDMNVRLDIYVNNDLNETFEGVNSGRFDLIAQNLTVTRERTRQIDFTTPLEQTRQILVQQKPPNWRQLSPRAYNDSLIRDQLALAGKTVYVQKGTAYYNRLRNLQNEIGDSIHIVQDSIYGTEQLVAMVAKGDINYTICDENIAKVNQAYYPNLDIQTPISFKQNIAWGIKKNSTEWRNYLDNWIRNFKKSKEFRIIYKKYFENNRSSFMVDSDYHSITGGKISPYDDLIKKICKKYAIDWRLVAAIIYHESDFNPDAQSWNGACGLMQVMAESADMFHIQDYKKPVNNITVGVRLLQWLDNNFKQDIPDPKERIKFVLAAYNVGLGHVRDAQRLAEKYHKIPIVWTNNVDYFLLHKSASKYYKDPVVHWGYCRGEEPYEYVKKVLNTYRHYCNIIKK